MPGPRLKPVIQAPYANPNTPTPQPTAVSQPPPVLQQFPRDTLTHEAAGINLGCTGCVFDGPQLGATTFPTWAKILAGMTAVAVVVWIAALAARR